MKLKVILTSMGICFPVLFSFAQYATDALRFSTYNVYGSARFQGLGGAQTALGADIGSVSGNPAGLGFYKKSEWSISPAISSANTRTNYLGTNTPDSKINFNIPSIGIVFASPKEDIQAGAWRGGAFGISYTRLSSFHNRFSYDATNRRTALADYFVEQANGISIPDLEDEIDEDGRAASVASQAYWAYVVNPTSDNQYTRYGIGQSARQQEEYTTSGAQYQWNFSYGGNFNDKLYLGASLGVARLRYGFDRNYEETYANADTLLSFEYKEDLAVQGTGVNLSLGLIYRPNDVVRFGASLTTPTFYNISEKYNSDLAPNFQSGIIMTDADGGSINLAGLGTVRTNTNEFEYKLQTPLRMSAGVAFFLGKKGFISGDIEYVAYDNMKLRASDYPSFKTENNIEIKNTYQPVWNVKGGAEYREGIGRFRLGFAYQSDPYKSQIDDLNRTKITLSAGAGVRFSNYYFDAAALHTLGYGSGYSPYYLNNGDYPSATIKNSYTNLVFTFGTFF